MNPCLTLNPALSSSMSLTIPSKKWKNSSIFPRSNMTSTKRNTPTSCSRQLSLMCQASFKYMAIHLSLSPPTLLALFRLIAIASSLMRSCDRGFSHEGRFFRLPISLSSSLLLLHPPLSLSSIPSLQTHILDLAPSYAHLIILVPLSLIACSLSCIISFS